MKIKIPGNPIAKTRHRCACRGRHPLAYDPQVHGDMAMVKHLMISEFNAMTNSDTREIAIEACNLTKAKSFSVQCVFGFQITRSFNKSQKNEFLWGFETHISKPDLDNLIKLYFDCGTGIIWKDDAQITQQSSRKIYTENPFVEIEVVANKELNMPYGVKEIMINISPSQLTELVEDAKELAKIPAREMGRELQTYNGLVHGSALPACAGMLREFAVKHSKILSRIAKNNE